VRHLALEQGSGNEMYLPIRQTNDYESVDLVVRASLPPTALASSIRSALKALDPNLPGNDFRPLQTLVDKAVSPRRFFVILLSGFSFFALILASLGIYAVISYSVMQRRQEIGIRMALGATSGTLQKSILGQTLTLASYGLLLGIGLSVLLAQTLRSLLYGVTTSDPTTFVSMLAVLVSVAALAGYIPAYRASRIDPMTALRVG
jgi:ABC-type antimicrobial peptide transport system permease subunit